MCVYTRLCMRSMRKINSVHDLHIHPVGNTCPLTNYVSAPALRCAARLKSKYNFSLFIRASPLFAGLPAAVRHDRHPPLQAAVSASLFHDTRVHYFLIWTMKDDERSKITSFVSLLESSDSCQRGDETSRWLKLSR